MNESTSQDQIYHSFIPLFLLPDDSAGRIARELWWTNQFPLLTSFHQGSPFSYFTWGMKHRLVSGHSSDTRSRPNDMIIISNLLKQIRITWAMPRMSKKICKLFPTITTEISSLFAFKGSCYRPDIRYAQLICRVLKVNCSCTHCCTRI
jgi:hypothetical protein